METKTRSSPIAAFLLRLAAFGLSLSAFILLIKDHQTVVTTSGILTVSQQIKYSNSSGLVYLAYSNLIAAVYCLVLAVLPILSFRGVTRPRGKAGAWVIWLLDQGLAYVLLAAASAATEVAYLAKGGNVKTSWQALCPTYGRFCSMLRASIALSFGCVVALAALSVLSLKHLFSTHYIKRPSALKQTLGST